MPVPLAIKDIFYTIITRNPISCILTYKIILMRQLVLVLLAGGWLCACQSADRKFDKQTYEQQKESLLDKESSHFEKFLVVEGEDRRNIWGQTVYRGKIHNRATVCSYNNVRVKLLYYKDGAQVANHEEVFDHALAPKETLSFKAKYHTPRGTDSVAVSVMSASPVK